VRGRTIFAPQGGRVNITLAVVWSTPGRRRGCGAYDLVHDVLSAHHGPGYRPREASSLLRGTRVPVQSRDGLVRDGELEATNYFFSIGDQENVLGLTYNHDGRTYEPGTGYGHIAVGVDDLDANARPAQGARDRT
jgi:hypothetical protein